MTQSHTRPGFFRSFVTRVFATLTAAGLVAYVGGARLDVSEMTFENLTGTGAEGLFKGEMRVRNKGLLPGGLQDLQVEIPEATGLEIRNVRWSRDRLLPLQESISTMSFNVIRSEGPLPHFLTLRFRDSDGDSFTRQVAVICRAGAPMLVDFVDVVIRNGRMELDSPAREACPSGA